MLPRSPLSEKDVGKKMYGLIEELYPICRSIRGNVVPLKVHEVPTGTQVFDWTVPREWNIDEAFIEDVNGNRLIDFTDHTLHVMSYSVPIDEVKSTSGWKIAIIFRAYSSDLR